MGVPLTVVGGYLGAGKTTVLNRLIRVHDATGICVIVNDFGELSVDAEILSRTEGVALALANGCVCCTAAHGLFKAFDTALGLDPLPTRILLEASGVADPSRIAAIARAEPDLEDAGIAVLVNAHSLPKDIEDDYKAPDMTRQIQSASAVLLSRVDIAPFETLQSSRGIVEALAPGAPVFDAANVRSVDELVQVMAGSHTVEPVIGHTGSANDRYRALSFRGDTLFDPNRFVCGILKMKRPPFRLKGLVRLPGAGRIQIVELDNGEITFRDLPDEAAPRECFITAIVDLDPKSTGELSRLVACCFSLRDAQSGSRSIAMNPLGHS